MRASIQRVFAAPIRILVALTMALCLTASAQAQDITFGPGLQDTLNDLDPGEEITVVVTFDNDGPVTTSQINAVQSLGVTQGIHFQSLPIMGVRATASQVNAIAGLDDVLSIWPNKELSYFNHASTKLTGVDRLRNDADLRNDQGAPFSGAGVSVVVNDSGVDGTHADHEFGSHLVENVQAVTNLNAISSLLPVTYLEGQPNTDTNSGHGTHVAGTVGGTGEQSNGKHEGVAPGADLIGYGSGGGLFILDALGGFDYAITHQFSFENPIRVVTNSWGTSGAFELNDPVNIASYAAFKRGITVTFAAGNAGPGEDTHNPYAITPWTISVGAGNKDGALADFSSRGVRGETFTFETPDGKTWTAANEIDVTAPGVDVISTRASTNLTANGGTDDTAIEPAYVPFYTMISGTSMATPHVAGIVALMLEANPSLQPMDVKRILEETATNMPGREAWEVGAGYVNAYAAVVEALNLRDFGATVNDFRSFDSNLNLSLASQQNFSIDFSPVGPTESVEFQVGSDIARVKARAHVPDNTVALVLIDPDGERYASAITLPILGEIASVAAPGKPGTWQLTVRGIGSVSGIPTDPLGVTNGTALPGTISGQLSQVRVDGFTGLTDIDGHPAESAIQFGVRERLVDAFSDGSYRPDDALTRAQLAEFLVMGTGIRQSLPLDGSPSFSDVSSAKVPFVEAATAKGAALKDRAQHFDGVIRADGSTFNPGAAVTRTELAYSLMQNLGFEEVAENFDGEVVVSYKGDRLRIEDQDQIPDALKGYVQLALDAGVLNAFFSLEQGPHDLEPTIHAHFRPTETVTRGDYAVAASRLFDIYPTASPDQFNDDSTSDGTLTNSTASTAQPVQETTPTRSFELRQNYPNPFQSSTQIEFSIAEPGPVELTVYNLLGQRVRTLVDEGSMSAGRHTVRFDGSNLSSGTYLYRLKANGRTKTGRMVLVK